MLYPHLDEVARYREVTNNFGGYNHNLSCQEGQFYDMSNITLQYYPIMSPRNKRGIVHNMKNPQGVLDKEVLMWIDDGKFYIDGKETALSGVTLSNEGEKTMAKMGAYVIIMPDKVWYNADNGECGYMESSFSVSSGTDIEFGNCDSKGVGVTAHDEEYYKENNPENGDYMIVEGDEKASLKVYSSITKTWVPVASTYVQLKCKGIGKNFAKGDGVKITVSMEDEAWKTASKDIGGIFVNDDGDGKHSINTTIVDRTDDAISIVGIRRGNTIYKYIGLSVERLVPDMDFITECNNRLWGCSKDGHEVYCCKLGDVKNWNCFQGISTDSWTATIGSDGKFTGATTFLGYPIFFKEDGFIKISVSSTGGHQIKETKCRGVQRGSDKSISILNEILYYKSPSGVCMYTGSLPVGISDNLGGVRYTDASAGTIGDRYYISMKDMEGKAHLFVYDSKYKLWCKEDNTDALVFCRHNEDLYYIDSADKKMKTVNGTLLDSKDVMEGKIKWYAETGNIGYSSPDSKYISRINLRITLEHGTNVDFYIQYDSDNKWEHKFNMSGNGTKTFTVPIIPKRCDHFKYKIVGTGGCKIHSITKTMEQGSDI